MVYFNSFVYYNNHMKTKLTGIYSGEQKPARRGVYKRLYTAKWRYCFWDGQGFGLGYNTKKEAEKRSSRDLFGYSASQDLPWRGVVRS